MKVALEITFRELVAYKSVAYIRKCDLKKIGTTLLSDMNDLINKRSSKY